MPNPKPPYPAGLRQQIVELVAVGRTPGELAREFNVSAQSISIWVTRSAVEAGANHPVKGLRPWLANKSELTFNVSTS